MLSRLELGPIWRALLRNKVGAMLIALQIAVTMTIIINAVFIIVERAELIERESGLDEANTFYLTSTGFGNDFEPQRVITEDLDNIRAKAGVIDAIQINAIPISGGGWSMSLQTEPGDDKDGTGTANYLVDEHALNTLDVELLAGENFTANDVRWRGPNQPDWPPITIITRTLAETIFPDISYQEVVGKTLYIGDDEAITVVGIIDKLQAPWIGWSRLEHAMLTPERMSYDSTRYLIRTEPGQRDRVMREIEQFLADQYPNRIIRNVETITETREQSYRQHSAMIKILSVVMGLLTIITALGIVGLTSFNVNRRRKQIGTRRALGASRRAILRYFMLENLLISGVGVVLGVALTIGLNIGMTQWLSTTPLDMLYLPIGVVALLVIGQLAVLGPALKAANISPAIATRTV